MTIGQTPVVTFAPLSNVCVNSGVQVLGGGLPTGGVYSGTGVTDNGNGLDFNFDPSTAGIGVHTLQYSYTDVNTCMNSNTSNVEVVALPNFVISGFNNPAICGTSTGDITLSGLTPLTGYQKPRQLEIFLKIFATDSYKTIKSQEAFTEYSSKFNYEFIE